MKNIFEVKLHSTLSFEKQKKMPKTSSRKVKTGLEEIKNTPSPLHNHSTFRKSEKLKKFANTFIFLNQISFSFVIFICLTLQKIFKGDQSDL